MFRSRLTLDGTSSTTHALSTLETECKRAGLAPESIASILEAVEGPLKTLLFSGQTVAASGGQFRADKVVEFPEGVVTIFARFNCRDGLIAWLRGLFTRS